MRFLPAVYFISLTFLAPASSSSIEPAVQQPFDSTAQEMQIESLVELAQNYLLLGRDTEAAAIYGQLVQMRPHNVQYLYAHALSLHATGNIEQSIVAYERLLSASPDNALAMNNLGYTYAEIGSNLPEALQLTSRAVELYPQNADFLDSKGWVLYRMERYEDARHPLIEATIRSPENAVILDHLGDVYMALRRYDEARTCWQRALDGYPENGSIQSKLSQLPDKRATSREAEQRSVEYLFRWFGIAFFTLGLITWIIL